jgi:hypothetical protein
MDAYPCFDLDFIVAIHFTSKFLARSDIKRSLTPSMPCMQVRPFVPLALLRAHGNQDAVK